jgi:hypothetical protein
MEIAVDTEIQYFAFADQDDVWNEEKLGIQLRLMNETRNDAGVISHSYPFRSSGRG